MTWTEAISEDKLSPGDRQVVKIGNQKILLVNQEGKIYAVDNACPHLKLPLKKGKISSDCILTCPFHRSKLRFSHRRGKRMEYFSPVIGNLMGKMSPEKSLPVFQTRIESGKVMVDL